MDLSAKPALQIVIKRKTEPLDHVPEENLSIERDFVPLPEIMAKEGLKIDPEAGTIHKDGEEDTLNTRKILEKAGTAYHDSWDRLHSYIRSFSTQDLEGLESYASTLAELPESNNLENDPSFKKKWAIYDLIKLGLTEDQIASAIEYLDSLPNEKTKEELFKLALDKIIKQEQTASTQVEIITKVETRLEISPPQVVPLNRRLPPPPPKKIKPSTVPEEKLNENLTKNKKVKKDEKINSFECLICFNLLPQEASESLLKCNHSFCKECYKNYLMQLILTNQISNLVCPNDGCSEKFEDHHLAKILEADQIARYTRLKKIAILNQNPDLKWCVNPGCEKYVISKKGERMAVCECGAKICCKCGGPYHSGKSCQSMIDKVYKKYVKEKNVQNCPQCKSRIEKSEGCNHITCSICQYQWCWLCRRKYTPNHFSRSNADGCPGLQNAEKRPPKEPKYLQKAKQVFATLGYCLVLPILAILAVMYIPNWLYDKRMEKKYGRGHANNMNNHTSTRLGLCFLGVFGFPIILAILVIYGLCQMFADSPQSRKAGR